MRNLLKIIRIQNLLFIALIQLLMGESVLVPILQTYGFQTALQNGMLSLLIIATVFIAAGGYVLNDYFDIKIDTINKPDKLIVGKIISRRTAMVLHQVLTSIGILVGLVLSYYARSFTLGLIYIVVPGLLWFYSASYKRMFIIGNLVIAFIAALSILIIGIAELAFLQKEFGKFIFETPIPGLLYGWISGFALFAFITTLIREVIKDIEDEKGDREMECRTMPIKWGLKNTKLFIYVLILITIIALLFSNGFFIHFEGTLTIRYILFGLIIPLGMLSYFIFKARSPNDFHQASTLIKVIMLIGILYSLVFYYLQAKSNGFTFFNLIIPN